MKLWYKIAWWRLVDSLLPTCTALYLLCRIFLVDTFSCILFNLEISGINRWHLQRTKTVSNSNGNIYEPFSFQHQSIYSSILSSISCCLFKISYDCWNEVIATHLHLLINTMLTLLIIKENISTFPFYTALLRNEYKSFYFFVSFYMHIIKFIFPF